LTATRHFTFDLTGALADQLYSAIPALNPAPFTFSALDQVDTVPGIYQLYLSGSMVYIGKADRDLRGRLYDHHRKISGRLNISTFDMGFTGLYLEGTWIPVGPETMLINRYKAEGSPTPWNFNGFGINDPGKERDTTNFKATHFDVEYPANLRFSLSDLVPGVYTVSEILPVIKNILPYVFRYQDRSAPHPDYLTSQVAIMANMTATQVFEALASSLPPGWQITALPGYVIMYKNIRAYPSAYDIFTS
jgi:Eco29kI restriction endonuclease